MASQIRWEDWEDVSIASQKKWHVLEDATGAEELDVLIAVKLRNTHLFTEILMSVSDPKSSSYGEYLTQKEVYDLSSPSDESVNRVIEWLKDGHAWNVRKRNNGGYVAATITVADAISLFSKDSSDLLQFYKFQHDIKSDRFVVRTTSPLYVPDDVAKEIQFIDGVNNFPYLQIRKPVDKYPHKSDTVSFGIGTGDSEITVSLNLIGQTDYSQYQVVVTQGAANQSQIGTYSAGSEEYYTTNIGLTFVFGSLANYVPVNVFVYAMDSTGSWVSVGEYVGNEYFPSVWITPQVTNGVYYIPPGTRSTNVGNSQAVAEFDGQFYSPDDLSTFSSLMGLPQPNVTVHGTNDPSKPGGESTLDIEWITAIGVDVPTTFWYVENGFLLTWVLGIAEDPNPPYVHSLSYGEPEKLVKDAIATRVNEEFQLLGQRGVTIISTSGDLGTSDGTPVCDVDVPDFPSSSPWTTSLGATFLTRDTTTSICVGQTTGYLPIYCDATVELPCAVDAGTGFTTGGGFSGKYVRPSYQDEAVQAYLDTAVLPPSSYFNASNRGFNDVGALGYHILTVQGGDIHVTGGTSASGPIFAGLLALLNDVQLNQNKPVLGFVNPWLYQVAQENPYAFNQVLSGDNKCRENGQECCTEGFVAQAGWNPLTGLGTPVYTALKDALP